MSSATYTGKGIDALQATVSQVRANNEHLDDLASERSSVESGLRWKILSAVFRRLNDPMIAATLQAHLAGAMYDTDGDPVEDYRERVSFYHDLGDISDCLFEGSRDVCKVCKCMEGLHTRNSYKLCPVQPGLIDGPRLLSNSFSK